MPLPDQRQVCTPHTQQAEWLSNALAYDTSISGSAQLFTLFTVTGVQSKLAPGHLLGMGLATCPCQTSVRCAPPNLSELVGWSEILPFDVLLQGKQQQVCDAQLSALRELCSMPAQHARPWRAADAHSVQGDYPDGQAAGTGYEAGPNEWADATSAATAARMFSERARAAAEAAERHASPGPRTVRLVLRSAAKSKACACSVVHVHGESSRSCRGR